MKVFILQWTFLLCALGSLNLQGQNRQDNRVRQPAVAGSFYPADAASLEAQLFTYFSGTRDTLLDEDLAAIIVPHAGYIFSGPVAAAAYSKLDPERSFKRIFVIGTSHHVFLDGASVCNMDEYRTPLGNIPVDTELAGLLIRENRLVVYVPEAHTKEHSIEVQLPFLQYRLKKPFMILPMVIGTQSASTCRKLAEILRPYFTPENLFVISSDFSHYPSYENAVRTDQATGLAVLSNSPAKFIETITGSNAKNTPGLATSCCGWSSVLTLLDITSVQNDIKISHIKYMNSGDSPYGDKNRVVGYHAFTFSRGQDPITAGGFVLSDEEKTLLLKIARESIESQLANRPMPDINESELPENLKLKCGAFVTLNKNDQLRGCIGRFLPDQPLYMVVREMAVAAAFRDVRFSPVEKYEMGKIDIEVSVLTPLKRIYSIDEFKLGEQGIYIIKGNRSGTFLPKVAESTGWNKEEFLGHCSRDKAGIGWEGWKDADLYTYEALVFDEKEMITGKK